MIPADKLSRIYAEMFLVDQWVRNDRDLSRMADTSLVYEPVLNKYGYTTEDYQATVSAYLEKPGDFAKVFNRTAEMLRARLDDITAREKLTAQIDSLYNVRRSRGWRVFTAMDLDSLMLPASKIDSVCGITAFVPPSIESAAVVMPEDSLKTAVQDSIVPPTAGKPRLQKEESPRVKAHRPRNADKK